MWKEESFVRFHLGESLLSSDEKWHMLDIHIVGKKEKKISGELDGTFNYSKSTHRRF